MTERGETCRSLHLPSSQTTSVGDGESHDTTVYLVLYRLHSNRYFIRSKAEPLKYWYFNNGDPCLVCRGGDCSSIHASTVHRTKFRLVTLEYNPPPKDFVMIGADEISILTGNYTLHIADTGELKAMRGFPNTDFHFRDLKNRFVSRSKEVAVKSLEYREVGLGKGSSPQQVICKYVAPMVESLEDREVDPGMEGPPRQLIYEYIAPVADGSGEAWELAD